MFSFVKPYQQRIEEIQKQQALGRELRDAAKNNDEDAVGRIVAEHGDDGGIINAVEKYVPLLGMIPIGGTALNIAVNAGNKAIVRKLLQASSIDVNVADPDFDNNPPILAAAIRYQPDIVVDLAARADIKVNTVGKQGQTVLMFAVYRCPAVLPTLLKAQGMQVNAVDPGGKTALHYACMKPDSSGVVPTYVEDLLKASDIKVDVRDQQGLTPLMYAEKFGNRQIVNRLHAKLSGVSAHFASVFTVTPYDTFIRNLTVDDTHHYQRCYHD